MGQNGFFQPEKLRYKERYFLWEKSDFIQVELIAYRPHPGELLVNINGELRVVHRRYLFSKSTGNGKIDDVNIS